MPRELSDEAFTALRETIKQIDSRTKRLAEWRSLGMTAQISENRLDVFLTMLGGFDDDPPTREQETALNGAWEDCKRHLLEAEHFPKEFAAIGLMLDASSSDTTTKDPVVEDWVGGLITAGKKVGEDVKMRRFVELKEHAIEFKLQFVRMSILRESRIGLEIKELLGLTNEVKYNLINTT